MLEMRPSCECCRKDLAADQTGAFICSFECTFCTDCANNVLKERCPNCGGALLARPTRSAELLLKYPASTTRVEKEHAC